MNKFIEITKINILQLFSFTKNNSSISDENVNKSFGDIFKETLEEELNGKSDIESKMIINSLVKYLNESLMRLKDLKDDFSS